jgi:hypothetical protein
MMTLDERKGLLWFRKHHPADWPNLNDPDCPPRVVLIRLLNSGLVSFYPNRRRFDPVLYSLTEAGRKALEP